MKNFKTIAIILATILLCFLTSLLLEIKLFQHPVRYALVVFTILIELLIGFLVLKEFASRQ